jgi:hypothetical protein
MSPNNVKSPRKKTSKAVEHQVREECGQACANPTCREWSTATHELHHIDGDRANSERANLILFCSSCHGRQIAGLISEADVRLWKRMAEAGALPPPKGQITSSVTMRDNYGIAGQTVNVGTVNMKRESNAKKRREITPGLIEADPDMRTYADYLVKRYIEWRRKGQAIDGRRFSAGSAHGILAEGFGSPSSVLLIPQERFQDWLVQAQAKIDRTTFGRINSRRARNYHTWEEHLNGRHGKSTSGDHVPR